MVLKVRGREYADEARNDPPKRYTICFEDQSSSSESTVSDSSACPVQATDVSTPNKDSRENNCAQETAKARAKARALAELKLEEMEGRELQMQMKIKRVEAKRELLELDVEDD